MKIIKEKPACSEPVAKEIVKRVLAICFFKGCWMVGVDNSEKLEFRGLKICLMASRLKFTITKNKKDQLRYRKTLKHMVAYWFLITLCHSFIFQY